MEERLVDLLNTIIAKVLSFAMSIREEVDEGYLVREMVLVSLAMAAAQADMPSMIRIQELSNELTEAAETEALRWLISTAFLFGCMTVRQPELVQEIAEATDNLSVLGEIFNIMSDLNANMDAE